LSEFLKNLPVDFEKLDSLTFFKESIENSSHQTQATEALLKFGGFPEPLLSGREDVHRIWQKNRLELLIRQDLRDLTRLTEVSQVEILASLLPEKVGSPISVQSLREDLEVAYTTVQRWLKFLEALYYQYEIKPYSKSIARSLKKEGKIYLFDWSSIDSPGARFENMVASHLLKMCHYYTDIGAANLNLKYLKNKEKKEVDFLILKNKLPWFTVEVKLGDLQLDPSFGNFQKQIKVPHFQIVKIPHVYREFKLETGAATVISFENFFSHLP